LQACKSLTTSRVQCELDSQIVVNQLTGQFRAKNAELLRLRDAVLSAASAFAEMAYRQLPRSLPDIASRRSREPSARCVHGVTNAAPVGRSYDPPDRHGVFGREGRASADDSRATGSVLVRGQARDVLGSTPSSRTSSCSLLRKSISSWPDCESRNVPEGNRQFPFPCPRSAR
jgi:hypothetical protein